MHRACTKVTLTDTWGTHQRSEPLTLLASVSCGSAELAFQLRSMSESAWSTVCAYSAQTSCALDLSTRPAGDYAVRALVRKAGSIAASDATSATRDFVLLAGSALLRALPKVDGYAPGASAISPDGRWLVGSGAGSTGLFRWSRSNGYLELPLLTRFLSSIAVNGISNTGLAVGALSGQSDINQAVLWSGSTITQLLPPTGYATATYAVSADGKVAVGDGTRGGLAAFRWTAKTGLVDIGAGFWLSGAHDVSADGSVVAGYGYTAQGTNAVATRWTASTGMVALPLLPGCTTSEARAVSQDGKVVVGECWAPGINHGYRWSAAGGLEDLGPFPGGSPFVSTFSTNGDGSVIVGNVVVDNQAVAVIWTPSTGFRYLSNVVAESGTDLAGWFLNGASDVTSDGKTILGYGNLGGYLVTLP